MQDGNGKRARKGGAPRVSETPPGENGHREYPAGTGTFFGVDNAAGRGQGRPEFESFMTAHTGDTSRLLAEAVLDEDLIEQYLNLMAIDQWKWGYKSMPSIMKAKVACTIGNKARGREDGVKVATSPMTLMRKGQSMMKRLFGGGGQGPGVPTPTQDMGY